MGSGDPDSDDGAARKFCAARRLSSGRRGPAPRVQAAAILRRGAAASAARPRQAAPPCPPVKANASRDRLSSLSLSPSRRTAGGRPSESPDRRRRTGPPAAEAADYRSNLAAVLMRRPVHWNDRGTPRRGAAVFDPAAPRTGRRGAGRLGAMNLSGPVDWNDQMLPLQAWRVRAKPPWPPVKAKRSRRCAPTLAGGTDGPGPRGGEGRERAGTAAGGGGPERRCCPVGTPPSRFCSLEEGSAGVSLAHWDIERGRRLSICP